MKKIFLLISVLIVAALLSGIFFYQLAKPVSNDTSSKYFLIPKGSSASDIANSLKGEGFIKNALIFRLYVRLTGSSQKIQAGQYKLSPSFSVFKVVSEILKGPVEVWVTVPEGLRREEIANRFISVLEPQDPNAFRSEFLTLSESKEGYLFPDTYLFPRDATPSMVVNKMLYTFDREITPQMTDDIAKAGFTLSKVIMVASLVERETKGEAERPVVAGIIYKRLNAGWPLQIDATLQYVVANKVCKVDDTSCKWWNVVGESDKTLSSPYNTYKNLGLPPTPIASPGLSSINAAIYPQSSDYWYYLHDGSGQIHYAKTLEEQNANIAKYLE